MPQSIEGNYDNLPAGLETIEMLGLLNVWTRIYLIGFTTPVCMTCPFLIIYNQ